MRRKSLKRLLMAATTILTMAATGIGAMAAEPFTLTVKTEGEPEHTFEAYQVFAGDYSQGQDGNGVLSNIEWGNGVTGDELLDDLKTDTVLGTIFADKTDAAGVAEALQDATVFQDNSEKLDQFAVVAGKHLLESGKTVLQKSYDDGYSRNYEAQLAPGYYLIKDKDDSELEGGSYTKFILELIQDTDVEAKLDTPSLHKSVESDDWEPLRATGYLQTNAAAIGSVQKFKLESEIPAMDGYDDYYFIVHDTLSKGLEFTGEQDLEIFVAEQKLGSDAYDLTVTKRGGETDLKIVIKNFIQYKNFKNGFIEIIYKAKVTKDAVTGVEGNVNTAKLEYSNDPYYDYKGDEPEDDPTGNPPTGETPETTAHVYTAKVRVAKVDEQGNSLEGAEFSLKGEGIAAVIESVNRITYSYVKAETGNFVMTEDGKMENYDESNVAHKDLPRYNRVEVKDTVVTVDGKPSEIKASVDVNGFLVFTGLGEGTYTLTETEAPKGYNKLEAPIEIKLSCEYPNPNDYPTVTTDCTWTATVDGENASVDADGTINIKIENKKGSMLPSTGGMGTTIFTVSGVILMLGAVVALIIKKKKGRS